jgi:hypothetical protein
MTVQARVCANNSIVKKQQKIRKRKKERSSVKISEAGHDFSHSSNLKII